MSDHMKSFRIPIIKTEIVGNENSTPTLYESRAKKYMESSKSANTRKAYRTDWQHFLGWCQERDVNPIPADPQNVSDYIADLADQGYKASTIQRRIASISQAHQMAGFESPTHTAKVRATWQGIRRELGTAPKQKKAASIEIIKAMCQTIPDTLLGHRNRALLLIGFASGSRRSELVSLDVEDVEFSDEGVLLHIRRSKTDQEGRRRKVGIKYGSHPQTCPVRSLQKWISESGITTGALFRKVDRHGNVKGRLTGDGVAYIIKRICQQAGFDPKDFAGHSLRRGFITTAHRNKKSEYAIMKQTGHKSIQTIRRYIEDADVFADNATDGIGL
jgi:site-specific recombinase XerD